MTDITENQYDLASQALDAIDAMKSDIWVAVNKNLRQFHFLRGHVDDMNYERLDMDHLIDCINEQIDDLFDESEKALRSKVKEFEAFESRMFRQQEAPRVL